MKQDIQQYNCNSNMVIFTYETVRPYQVCRLAVVCLQREWGCLKIREKGWYLSLRGQDYFHIIIPNHKNNSNNDKNNKPRVECY